MPNDEFMPSLVRLSSACMLPAQIKLPDRARASVTGVPPGGGVPPMFQWSNPERSDPRGPEQLSD